MVLRPKPLSMAHAGPVVEAVPLQEKGMELHPG